MARVVVLGSGMMGSAMAMPASDAGNEVRLVGSPLDDAIVAGVTQDGIHPTLRVLLPTGVVAVRSPAARAEVAAADAVILGVSSPGVPWAASCLESLRPGVPVAMITKGLHLDGRELQTLPDRVAELAPRATLAPVAVAGPCIAGELARRVETCVVFTGRDRGAAVRLAALLRTSYYLPTVSSDVVGVEVCAALKNAFAMGVGLGAGLHERRGGVAGSVALHNWESAVLARSILEMQVVIGLLGGDPASAAGLAGVGDLTVTCNGGRTGRFGRWLGLGLGRAKAIEAMQGATLECLEILAVTREAMAGWDAKGVAAARRLRLLRALGAIALDDAPAELPLAVLYGDEAADAT